MSEDNETTPLHQEPKETYFEGPLYHGSKPPFDFDPNFDYTSDQIDTDGSWTLGPGLYLLDNYEGAESYSKVRQPIDFDQPYTYQIRAPNCRFLDFRDSNDAGHNLPVPKWLIKQWSLFFSSHLQQEIDDRPDLGEPREIIATPGSNIRRVKINREHLRREDKKRYLSFLKELEQKEKVDLRVMFGTAPSGKTNSGFEGSLIGPEWGDWFREFVINDLRYDGIIYIEGGEGKNATDNATFIVYKLNKITDFLLTSKGRNRSKLSWPLGSLVLNYPRIEGFWLGGVAHLFL